VSITIIGGTGTVGGETVRHLTARGVPVRVVTRSAEKIASLPKGATGVVGDTAKPETLGPALRGTERLFLITALAEHEEREGLAAIEAAKAAGVKRIVVLSVHNVDSCPEAPHFASKIAFEKAIEQTGLEWTSLQPNNYFQNDSWFRQAILEYGVYPQPIGQRGISRVDVRDIAEVAAKALTGDDLLGRKVPLVGPEPLTGPRVAEIWSQHLGKPIQYAGDDLNAWAEQSKPYMPKWLIDDLAIMYGHFQKNGLPASPADLGTCAAALGHAPRRFEKFVEETVQGWKA
jgi:uncharacterized protein YbjT (DUF2867 family)